VLYIQGVIKLDINTFLLDMDVLIPEHVVRNRDGSYSIFINSRLSYDRQLEAYKHALKHIKDGDFDKKDADRIEFEAHNLETATEICFA